MFEGAHVARHGDGRWNGVSCDQFGEQTYIRVGKSKGGLVGISLSAEQVSGWVLSYHICHLLSSKMDGMFDDEPEIEGNGKHKEEGLVRRKNDCKDRDNIRKELNKHSNPLTNEYDNLCNIVNGCIADQSVNVYNALDMGDSLMRQFKAGWPETINKPIKTKLVTLESTKRPVKISGKSVFDIEKLYGCMLVINQKRNLSLDTLFDYELSPVPASLFDDYGSMRKGDKGTLVSSIGIPAVHLDPIQVEILDGGGFLYCVSWPKQCDLSQRDLNQKMCNFL